MKEQFTSTYTHNKWGDNESRSGPGSSMEYTSKLRSTLPIIIKKYKINKIFDCSCGDWNWMKEIREFLPVYIGNDIVEELVAENNKKYKSDSISFVSNDMLSQLKLYENKSFDLIICRHTLEHLEEEYILNVLNEIKRVGTYAILTSVNHTTKNENLLNIDGFSSRPINLELPPFADIIGEKIDKIHDTIGEEKEISSFSHIYKL
jgi:ubiquinone/menaquinone biosynthesis C-methylase UbiE